MARFVAGLVLGAGASKRLGQPKQLLEYRGLPLLQAAVNNMLASKCSQVLVAIGGSAPDVRTDVDFDGCVVVENVAFTTGCSSSIVAALDAIDDRAEGLVLTLGDQPGVTPKTIDRLIAESTNVELAVCRYGDGRGHPFWFARNMFGELRGLQGDKAVWKMLEAPDHLVLEVPVSGDVPPDVDTIDDYDALLAAEPSP